MEQQPRERRKRRIRRKTKRNKQAILFLFLFVFVTIPAITGCIYFTLKYQALENQTQEAWKEIEAEKVEALEPKEVSYSEEQMQELLEKTKEENSQQFLNTLKQRMNSGDGTTAMLRYFYPKDIVIVDANKYQFLPISDTLQKHTYVDRNFKLNEKEELEYIEKEQVLSKKGIDVSKYQGEIDWEKVKQDKVEYAFIRLGLRGYGSGKLVVDEMFEENVMGASSAGVKAGAYFVTQAISEAEAIEEAEFVLENLAPLKDKITYPIAIDVEEVLDKSARTALLTKEERTKTVIAFCEKIKEAGYQPMIYGNLKSFMLMLDMNQLEEYPKWFANYSQPVYFPYQFAIWQYSAKGQVDGIKKGVDVNVEVTKP